MEEESYKKRVNRIVKPIFEKALLERQQETNHSLLEWINEEGK